MKKQTVIILVCVLLLAAGAYFVFKKRKGSGLPSWLDQLGGLFRKDIAGQTVTSALIDQGKYPGQVAASESDEAFMKSLGYGEIFMSLFSKADKKLFRDYIENYVRKGLPMLPTDPRYKELVRINSYANVFPNLPKS